jgi:DNA-binding LacI/PurR family transcriptional regulator
VLNKSRFVSPELVSRVESAIAELGYVPNIVGRTLRTKRSHTIALLTSNIANPISSGITEGIEKITASKGYSLLICATHGRSDLEEKFTNLLLQQRVEGLLIDSILEGSTIQESLQARSLPFVLISRRLSSYEANYVGVDNHDGMIQIIRYLCSLGHKRIAHVSGDPISSVSRERMAGYKDGLSDCGIQFDPEIVVSDSTEGGTYGWESGYLLASRLMNIENPPTAIAAINDTVAFGIWRWLNNNGLKVPDNVSLVGFDNIEASEFGPIGLTTVRINKTSMGEKASMLLIQEIEGMGEPTSLQVILPVELVVRDTCGPPHSKST